MSHELMKVSVGIEPDGGDFREMLSSRLEPLIGSDYLELIKQLIMKPNGCLEPLH